MLRVTVRSEAGVALRFAAVCQRSLLSEAGPRFSSPMMPSMLLYRPETK